MKLSLKCVQVILVYLLFATMMHRPPQNGLMNMHTYLYNYDYYIDTNRYVINNYDYELFCSSREVYNIGNCIKIIQNRRGRFVLVIINARVGLGTNHTYDFISITSTVRALGSTRSLPK